jgi:hypothetical protein
MVRLVFRPYTQVKRTICTSVSLRASTRVSPGFTLLRHSSPSFGSQQICFYSNLPQANDRSMVPPGRSDRDSHLSSRSCLHFHCASGFSTQILAYMLDSLVRVSRRVNENHFVSILERTSCPTRASGPRTPHAELLFSVQRRGLGHGGRPKGALTLGLESSVCSTVAPGGYNRNWPKPAPYLPPSLLPQGAN